MTTATLGAWIDAPSPTDPVCRSCGRSFQSRHGVRVHHGHVHTPSPGIQSTLDDYIQEPAWTPGRQPVGDTRWACANCGQPVSQRYHRVWSVDGQLEGCYNCKSRTQRYSNDPVIDPDDEERQPFDTDTNV